MRRIEFRNYAGFKISGKEPMSKHGRDTHLLRASYLTAMVESGGKFGCVINYDGTAMTAGIHQAIAVYPKELRHPDQNIANDQGPLWKLLNRVSNIDDYCFKHLLNNIGWYLAPDHTVRYLEDGSYVDGFTIRKEFTGASNGVAPLKGPGRENAERWVFEFHDLFSDPDTFEIQENYGIEHFVKRANRAKFRFCKSKNLKKLTLADTVYGDCNHITVADLSEELDLAMCMYWSHSVNAPGIALKKLCSVMYHWDSGRKETFARTLIKKLGTSGFARWDDDIKNGRYQRTRRFAKQSGFWPKSLFVGKKAIMPKDFPG